LPARCFFSIDRVREGMERTADHVFFDLEERYTRYETAAAVILPVPFDATSTWRKGSAGAPEAVRLASRHVELYDLETGREVYRRGICGLPPVEAGTSREMVERVCGAVAAQVERGKFVVTLGGEHTVAVGAVRACAARNPGMSVLHLDAHADRRETYLDDPLNHACAVARIRECVSSVVSVGVRSCDACEVHSLKEDAVITAREVRENVEWTSRVLESLGEKVYVTLDVDVFDPAVLPSTGTPEPGGLDWYHVTGLLRRVAEQRRIVACDVTELCPDGRAESEFTVAKLVYKILTYALGGEEK